MLDLVRLVVINLINEMFAGVAGEFENAGSRKRARAYVLGLLSHAERKNGWTLADSPGICRRAGCSGC